MKIARLFHFEAAHTLTHHDGKCHRIHGHSYRLELVFTGTLHPLSAHNPQSGFVVDFGLVDRIVQKNLLEPYLDHFNLNESIPELPYPSAEYLAAWIMNWCIHHLDRIAEMGTARIHRVRVWETAHSWAEADRDDPQQLGLCPT